MNATGVIITPLFSKSKIQETYSVRVSKQAVTLGRPVCLYNACKGYGRPLGRFLTITTPYHRTMSVTVSWPFAL